jgi:hypothetical protein
MSFIKINKNSFRYETFNIGFLRPRYISRASVSQSIYDFAECHGSIFFSAINMLPQVFFKKKKKKSNPLKACWMYDFYAQI